MHSFELRTSSTLPLAPGVTGKPEVDHKSETVRIRLRGLQAFMRWVVMKSALRVCTKAFKEREQIWGQTEHDFQAA